MKKAPIHNEMPLQPAPQILVSSRDRNGRNMCKQWATPPMLAAIR